MISDYTYTVTEDTMQLLRDKYFRIFRFSIFQLRPHNLVLNKKITIMIYIYIYIYIYICIYIYMYVCLGSGARYERFLTGIEKKFSFHPKNLKFCTLIHFMDKNQTAK